MTRPVTCPGRAYPPRRNGKVMRDWLTGLVIGVVVGTAGSPPAAPVSRVI